MAATSASGPFARGIAVPRPAVPAAYALGALFQLGEAAVHVQQYVTIFHAVRWVGPLFLANAVASVLSVAALGHPRTRSLGALAGVVISVVALGSLVVSYGEGLFGWQEAGFRTPIAVAVITEVGAVILLSTGLMLTTLLPGGGAARARDV